MNTRRVMGWTAFFAVAGALAWYPDLFMQQDDPAPVQASRAPSSAPAAPAQAPLRDLSPGADLFAAQTWAVVAPAPTAEQLAALQQQQQQAAPAPTAPAMPFQFIGRLDDNRDLQVFLQNGEKLYVVRKGDVIDDTWRIESINDKALSLVYLPLHLTQTLSVGSNP